jgi:hypothetical protein
MLTDGMEFASEMVVRASLAKLDIVEVPTTLRPDGRSRAPHLRTWPDGWRHLRFLLAFSPRWLMLYPAMAVFCAGAVGLVILGLSTPTVAGVSFSIQTMLACATATVVGLQTMAMAVVSRCYAVDLGLLPVQPRLERLLGKLTLERGLVIGLIMAVAGIVGFAAALGRWSAAKFQDLDPMQTMQLPIVAMVLVVGGLQLMTASFTISLSQINSRRA